MQRKGRNWTIILFNFCCCFVYLRPRQIRKYWRIDNFCWKTYTTHTHTQHQSIVSALKEKWFCIWSLTYHFCLFSSFSLWGWLQQNKWNKKKKLSEMNRKRYKRFKTRRFCHYIFFFCFQFHRFVSLSCCWWFFSSFIWGIPHSWLEPCPPTHRNVGQCVEMTALSANASLDELSGIKYLTLTRERQTGSEGASKNGLIPNCFVTVPQVTVA